MSKVFKVVRNALNKKAYYENISELNFCTYDKKNPIPLDEDKITSLKNELEVLCIRQSQRNLKVYLKTFLRIKLNKFRVTVAPACLIAFAAFTLANPLNETNEEFACYDKVITSFDERGLGDESAKEQVEHGYIKEIKSPVLERKIIPVDEKYKVIDSLESTCTLNLHNGIKDYEVKYVADEYNNFSVTDYVTKNDYNFQASPLDNLNRDEFIDYLCSSLLSENVSKNMSQEIESLLSDSKNNINGVIEEYRFTGNQFVDIKSDTDIEELSIVLIILYLAYLFTIRKSLFNIKRVRFDGYELIEYYDEEKMNFLYSLNRLKKELYLAEKERVKAIDKILSEYNCSKDILNKYEKKLINIEDKKE